MIVWGGRKDMDYFNTGGLYDPVTDTWTTTSTGANCPSERLYHTTVWTGSEMIVWGGDSGILLNNGGIYIPDTSCTPPSTPAVTSITDNDPCVQDGLTIIYVSGTPATRHDLFMDGGLAQSDFISGSTFNPGDTAQHSYVIRAINGDDGCTTDSLPEFGIDADCIPPGEVSQGDTYATALQWSANKTTLNWQTATGTVEGYYIFRGVPDDLPLLLTGEVDSCTRYDGTDLFMDIPEIPTAGEFYWFIVTAYNTYGMGSAGEATGGERIVDSSGDCP